MAPFLYYVQTGEGPAKNSKEALTDRLLAAGFAHLFEDPALDQISIRQVLKGPDNRSGSVLCVLPPVHSDNSAKVGFYPAKQEWKEAEKGVWLGLWKDDAPGPVSLQRTHLINGHMVKLNDGAQWLVPTVRCWPRGTRLPCILLEVQEGQIEYQVETEYVQLMAEAEEYHKAFFGSMAQGALEGIVKVDVTIDTSRLVALARQGLALNYRIGWREASMLRLFTDSNVHDACLALIDWPTMESFLISQAEKKKKQLDPDDSMEVASDVEG